MQSLKEVIQKTEFFQGLEDRHLDLIAGCARLVVFQPGEYLFKEGREAQHFFLIRHGRVSIELHIPPRGQVMIQTVGPGEILGWSWLVPPHRWRFDAKALTVVRAIRFDGQCIRTKCESDHTLGYELMKRFTTVMAERLQATRIQLLDIYGTGSKTG